MTHAYIVHANPDIENLDSLLQKARACRVCEQHLPHEPRPILQASASARLLIVGQAPGARAHVSGVPWSDPSGERLRDWMGINTDTFYDAGKIAILPMGLCYPGRATSGDLPPRRECAPLWHERLLAQMPGIKLTLLIGGYAQACYLKDAGHATVTETTRNWRTLAPSVIPLPHPSPRNVAWFKANPWFDAELVPVLKRRSQELLS